MGDLKKNWGAPKRPLPLKRLGGALLEAPDEEQGPYEKQASWGGNPQGEVSGTKARKGRLKTG